MESLDRDAFNKLPADERLLRLRARSLSAPAVEPVEIGASNEVLVVGLAGGRYALPLRDIDGMVPLQELVALPGAPAFVAGVANLQGSVITVIELRRLLSLGGGRPKVAIVVDVGSGRLALGVDRYEGVQDCPATSLRAHPGGEESETRYLKGIVEGGIGLLNVEKLIQDILGDSSAKQHRSGA